MGRAASARQSLEEYLRWESTQTVRHDFWRGEVYAMTGGSLRHNRATLATAMTLQRHLQDTPCQVFVSDVRVAVDAAQHWFYPDVVVTCDPQDLDDPDATALRAPVMVLECCRLRRRRTTAGKNSSACSDCPACASTRCSTPRACGWRCSAATPRGASSTMSSRGYRPKRN